MKKQIPRRAILKTAGLGSVSPGVGISHLSVLGVSIDCRA